MISQIQMSNGDMYTVNQTRHAPEGWTPTRIERSGDWFIVYNGGIVRSELNVRHVVSVIIKDLDENKVDLHD